MQIDSSGGLPTLLQTPRMLYFFYLTSAIDLARLTGVFLFISSDWIEILKFFFSFLGGCGCMWVCVGWRGGGGRGVYSFAIYKHLSEQS